MRVMLMQVAKNQNGIYSLGGVKISNIVKIREKSIIGYIKKLDKKISDKAEKLKKYVIIRFLAKLFSQIMIGVLISIAIYISNSIYDNATRLKIEEEKLSGLAVGISQDYMKSLFSIPQVEYTSIFGYHISAYILDDYVVVATFDKETLVSYFIAITDDDRKLDLSAHYGQENIVLGETTFYDTNKEPNAEVNMPASGTYMYYCETSYYGRPGDFNNYIYAFTPYGTSLGADESDVFNAARKYLDDNTTLVNGDNAVFKSEYDEARKNVRPNTFGIIMFGYEEKISVVPFDDEWINILGVIHQYGHYDN